MNERTASIGRWSAGIAAVLAASFLYERWLAPVLHLDESIEAAIAVTFYIAVVAYGIWRTRKIPGYWSAEAIRQRSRESVCLVWFVGCLVCVAVFLLDTIYRDQDYVWFILWSFPFAVIAWFVRPRCCRRCLPQK